jgi:alanine racemase
LTAYRPGLSLYGYNPIESDDSDTNIDLALKPALKVITKIVSVQKLAVNETASYNESFRALQETNIAVIPFGYFEGLDRRLSNKAKLFVAGINSSIWAPIAGKVCMNLTCLNVGQNDIQKGDTVTVISDNREDQNSVSSLVRIMNTIPYEFLVRLNQNIRREIIWK